MTKAADETETITVGTQKACNALSYFNGRVYNGWGELSDPSVASRYLREARASLELADAAFDRASKAGWSRDDE